MGILVFWNKLFDMIYRKLAHTHFHWGCFSQCSERDLQPRMCVSQGVVTAALCKGPFPLPPALHTTSCSSVQTHFKLQISSRKFQATKVPPCLSPVPLAQPVFPVPEQGPQQTRSLTSGTSSWYWIN